MDREKIERETDRVGNQVGNFATRHPRWAAGILLALVVAVVIGFVSCAARAATVTMTCPNVPTVAGKVATCTVADAPTTPPAGGGGTTPPPASCPVVPSSNNMVLTAGTYAIPFTPKDTKLRTISWSPHLGGGSWDYAISATACDFASPIKAVGGTGKLQTSPAAASGLNGYITARVKGGVNVTVGTVYYFNVRGDSGAIIAGAAP